MSTSTPWQTFKAISPFFRPVLCCLGLTLVATTVTLKLPALAAETPKIRILNQTPIASQSTTPPRQPPDSMDRPAKRAWAISWWGIPRAATAGTEHLAALISSRTGGRWTLKIHYGGALSAPDRNLDGLKAGRFQMAALCDFFHPRKTPALSVLSLPFLPIADRKTHRKIREAVHAHPAVKAEFESFGAHLFMSTYLPPFELVGRGAPPKDLEYWQGRAVRAGGGIGRAMTVLGAIPVNATMPEIADGLRDGSIQVAALPVSYALSHRGIRNNASWYTSNLAAGSAECALAISQAAYDKLPANDKKLLQSLRPAVIAAQLEAYRQRRLDGPADGNNGPRAIRFTDKQIATYRNTAGRPVINAWIERHQRRFDAAGLVQTVFSAAGLKYE